MANYKNKLASLKSRRQDGLTKAFSVTESFNKNVYGESTTYAMEAMEPISATYTQNTYKACEKVQNQLKVGLKEYNIEVDFRYQGSVPANIHIKNYSDIDLLTIHGSFFTLQSPQEPSVPYLGDPLEDLKNLRRKTFRILDTVYTGCNIDDSSSKCINISGGSLNRKIDIIAANWFNALIYAKNPVEVNRGIQILDRDSNTRIINFPFLHIYWINVKDDRVGGNAKRIIRLLKTLKADAGVDKPGVEIKVSSYDIASLVYRMDDALLTAGTWHRLQLLQNTNAFLLKVINDSSYRNSLDVANGTRRIFCPEGCHVDELAKLRTELQELTDAISGDLRPLNENFEKATIYY